MKQASGKPLSYQLQPVRVVFGEGSSTGLHAELVQLKTSRVFIVTSRGRAAAFGPLIESLANFLTGTFDGAVEHVPAAVVDAALGKIENAMPDILVAIGGGSAIGLAKAVVLKTGLPLGAIPTTYSGSEMTSIWGTTDEQGKRTGRDSRVAPKLVIYDPLLTCELSPEKSAASGMNAIAHGVEALYAPNATHPASAWAEESIRLLASSLPAIVRSPADTDARRDAFMGAHLAGRCLDMTSMGLHHRICHVLGGHFGLPHSRTHAVMLPYVTAFNLGAAKDAATRLSRALGSPNPVQALIALSQSLPLPRSLGELGFADSDVDRASAEISEGGYPNPRSISTHDVARILRFALSGSSPETLSA